MPNRIQSPIIACFVALLLPVHGQAQGATEAPATAPPTNAPMQQLMDTAVADSPPLEILQPKADEEPTAPELPLPAPIFSCSGHDDTAAIAASKRGKNLFKAAVARKPLDTTELNAALTAFDAQCAAGDSWALEARAAALVMLQRELEAAQSLDAFFALHPAETLPADVKVRIDGNKPLIYGKVGTIQLSTNSYKPSIAIDGGPTQALQTSTLRVLPGRHTLRMTAPGFHAAEQQFEVPVGATVQVSFGLKPVEAGVAVEPDTAPARAPIVVKTEERPSHSNFWPIVLGASSVAAIGVGVAGTVASFSAADDYSRHHCADNPSQRGCKGLKSNFHTAVALEVAGFATGAALGTAAVTWWLLGKPPSDEETSDRAGLQCELLGTYASCAGRW